MIEPARRAYDAETRERLVELFGPPERWGTTTRSLLWHQADVLVPALHRRHHLPRLRAVQLRPGGRRRQVPLRRCRTARCRWPSTSTAPSYYRGDDGRLQMSLVPWSCSAEFRLPVGDLARADRALLPDSGWIAAAAPSTLEALQREKARAALPTLDACVGRAARGAAVSEPGARWSTRCSTRATRSTRTRRARPRTRRRRRSGSSTRPPTRAAARHAPSTTSSCECVLRGRGRRERRGALPAPERRAPPGRAAAHRGRRASFESSRSRSARGSSSTRSTAAARPTSLPRREPHRGAEPASTGRPRCAAR